LAASGSGETLISNSSSPLTPADARSPFLECARFGFMPSPPATAVSLCQTSPVLAPRGRWYRQQPSRWLEVSGTSTRPKGVF
jgi:hypothetical protein